MENLLLEWRINEALQNMHPMHYAAKRGDVEVMKELINRGCVANCMTFDCQTPLHIAAANGMKDVTQFLLDEGAWINATNIDGATPLCEACANGHIEVARILIEHNASVNAPMLVPLLNSPLHEAVLKGHVDCVNLLISKGAKLNVTDRTYGTPLHAACVAYKVSTECIISLIQAGADVDATIIHKTALHLAAYRNLIAVVRILLTYGANVYMKDNSGKQAKELAASNSAVQKILLHAEINPRTLQNSCRLVILRSFVIGKNTNYISQLGLPYKIVKYIFSQC